MGLFIVSKLVMQFTGQFNARFYVVELVIQAETKLGRIRIVVGS